MNGRYSASNFMTSLPQPGHNPPVEVTFQFQQVGRPVIEASVRNPAIKLTPSLPQAGQKRSFLFSTI